MAWLQFQMVCVILKNSHASSYSIIATSTSIYSDQSDPDHAAITEFSVSWLSMQTCI